MGVIADWARGPPITWTELQGVAIPHRLGRAEVTPPLADRTLPPRNVQKDNSPHLVSVQGSMHDECPAPVETKALPLLPCPAPKACEGQGCLAWAAISLTQSPTMGKWSRAISCQGSPTLISKALGLD